MRVNNDGRLDLVGFAGIASQTPDEISDNGIDDDEDRHVDADDPDCQR